MDAHLDHNLEQEQEPSEQEPSAQEPSARAEAPPVYLRHLNPMKCGSTPLPSEEEALEQDFSVLEAWRLLR